MKFIGFQGNKFRSNRVFNFIFKLFEHRFIFDAEDSFVIVSLVPLNFVNWNLLFLSFHCP